MLATLAGGGVLLMNSIHQLDSLRSITRSCCFGENDPEMGSLIYDLKHQITDAGGTLLLIHHCNKANDTTGTEALSGHNAIAGAANRSLGRFAERICVGFAEAARFFPPGRAVHTGNPIRPEVLAAPAAAPHDGPGLLIFGGSQGAHHLNEASVAALDRIGPRAAAWRIRHQTGAADLAEVSAAYRRLGLMARVESFVDDMGGAYREADVVVSRAGAMSCAEITALGLPSLLVPYPWAADDHQRRNAEILVEGGGAQMILDRDLDGDRLAAALSNLLVDREARAAMAARARALGRPDAARHVAEVCVAILRARPT
jgi:UDP-N-acetylglucosamine--N-acetylmuramyl-(pentapeptide) pyrophosphoryl-undecaprenol N-acetylglucosamine transferase